MTSAPPWRAVCGSHGQHQDGNQHGTSGVASRSTWQFWNMTLGPCVAGQIPIFFAGSSLHPNMSRSLLAKSTVVGQSQWIGFLRKSQLETLVFAPAILAFQLQAFLIFPVNKFWGRQNQQKNWQIAWTALTDFDFIV